MSFSSNSSQRSPTRRRILLQSTKSLLEILTAWASHSASVEDVSAKFVQLGDDFNSTKKLYISAGVDVTDIKDAPFLLRGILENSLVLEPSPETLEQFLPKIGEIVNEMMKTLKTKQAECQRLIEARRAASSTSSLVGTSISSPPSLTSLPGPNGKFDRSISGPALSSHARQDSLPSTSNPVSSQDRSVSSSGLSMKSPSYIMNGSNGSLNNDFKNTKNMNNNYYDGPTNNSINSSNLNGGDYELGSPLTNGNNNSTSTFRSTSTEARDPITRLQNRDMLSRRASKRFSAYQSQKMISKSSPLMEDPSKNRFSSPKFNKVLKAPNSPLQEEVSRNIRESESQRQAMNNVSNEIKRSNSVSIKVPEISLTTTEPSSSYPKNTNSSMSGNGSHISEDYRTHDTDVIYLKLANRIKKVDVKFPLTIQQLQILFTQKFAYSPSDEKIDSFPPIYIQDSGSSISYELEDIKDVKQGVVLTLLETTDNEKLMKNMEQQIDTLKSDMSKMEETLMENLKQISSSIIDSVQSAQTAQTAEVAKVAAVAAAAAAARPSSSSKEENKSEESKATSSSKTPIQEKGTSKTATNNNTSNLDAVALKKEVEEIRHELVKARQHSSDIKKNASEKIADALKLISQFQSLSTSSNSIISNPYMENCKKKVSEECEELVTRIDDLQDIIEALKLDISKRGSKPNKQQITYVSKEMTLTKDSLEKLSNYMSSERKNWNQRWQAELTAVLEEQEFFKEQETIVQLLSEDIKSADETYGLIVKCCEELEKNPTLLNPRSLQLPLPEPGMSVTSLREALMSEVAALNPDHESRVEAIAKAERVREKEKLVNNINQFEVELGDFVDGEKLKKSGGIEEIERIRKQKDEQNLKGQFVG
ncbi:hypothetical protein B5S31_g1101 [[Candida] boidinii]|nr:hypothetical protein B5S31_g1101 [[Candida] boidinii]